MSDSSRAPYAVLSATFPFPALAKQVGALPLGQGRESVLAVLLAARIAATALHPDAVPAAMAKRVEAASRWIASSCPDRSVRSAVTALCAAAMAGKPGQIREHVERVIDVTAVLSSGARMELRAIGHRRAG